MINIGNTLKEHRLAFGYTQSLLAKATGIKQQNISRWENNLHNPDIIDCITLAQFYGITLEELLGISDNFELTSFDAPKLGNKKTAPINGAAPDSSDEGKLLSVYRSLSDDMRDTLWSLLATWTPTESLLPAKKT